MKCRFYLSFFLNKKKINKKRKDKDFSKKKEKQEFYFHKVFKILGAKNRRKNLQKPPGPTFQIRPGPGYLSIAEDCAKFLRPSQKS